MIKTWLRKISQATQFFLVVELSWLPAGKMSYQAFSVRPDRVPSYENKNTEKSFLLDVYWRYPGKNWGVDFNALQAGRTHAEETIGTYQHSPMSLSVTSWQLAIEREVWNSGNSFLAGLVGVGVVSNQWERTRNIFVNGTNVDSDLGLSPDGTGRSGIRTSLENLALPLGARMRFYLSPRLFNETVFNYSFLMDLTDTLQGSSPFSGWESQLKSVLGWHLTQDAEFYLGFYGAVDHMSAPTGQGGLRLNGGPSAPEGVYVLWQVNEVHLATALLGFGWHF